jgi:hypothetical protein
MNMSGPVTRQLMAALTELHPSHSEGGNQTVSVLSCHDNYPHICGVDFGPYEVLI